MDEQGTQRGNDAPAARIVFSPTEFGVVLAHIGGDGQTELGRMLAVGRSDLCIHGLHHMQDDIVVGGVELMAMALPVAGAQVDFHVAHPHLTAHAHLGVEKIGTRMAVVQSGVDDFHLLPVGGRERTKREDAVFPDVVQQLFHHSICAFANAKVAINCISEIENGNFLLCEHLNNGKNSVLRL